ncbi:MAG: hypothetical protein WDO19_30290 [Bacteroidota bacterium]
MLRKQYKFLVFILLMLLFINDRILGQDYNAAFTAADSSGFSVNSHGGWQLFNSYVAAYKTDSVSLEIIIQHANNINWSMEQYVGSIKTPEFIPHAEQNISYNLVVTVYSLRIDTGGKCYLRIASGILPQQEPSVIPLKIDYKK